MTGHGRSDPVYGGKPHMKAGHLPIQGVLQGNGMGPFIWALISTVLLKCMESMGYVAQLVGILTGVTLSFVGCAFVDDTDICFTAKDNHTPAVDILPECQEGLDFWQGTLECTGGGLEHRDNKTFWHLIDFKWTGHKWECHTKRDSPGDLSIKMTDSEDRAVLCRKEAHEASETLGIFIAMDGNWEGQVEKLMTKATGWADAFRTCRGLERNDAWEGLLTTIMATFKCPAIATTITEAQWDDIMRPVLQAGLPKAGIVRSFPREVLFGPEMYQGMGMMHPFHFQELEHLETILRTGNEETTTGTHLQMSLEALKLELGMPGSIWALDHSLLGACATQCWMKAVWKCCWDHCTSLSDPTPDLPLRREHDKHIMQVFVQSRKYSSEELRKLNVCRCFLKATALADICTADGSEITGEATEGIQTDDHTHSPEWPRQPSSLKQECWNLWKRALNECLIRNTTQTKLWLPLGKWLDDPINHAPWLCDSSSKQVCSRHGNKWKIYASRTRPRRGTIFRFNNEHLETPPQSGSCRAASVTHMRRAEGTTMLNSIASSHVHDPEQNTEATTLEEKLATLHPSGKWAVERVQFGADEGLQTGGNVAAAIIRGNARAVSDGSCKDGHGTSAFTINGDTFKKAIQGQNTIPGHPEEQCACRSELGGVAGILTMLEALCEHCGLDEGAIEIGLDGESVIKKLQHDCLPKPKDSHYDLLLDCRRRMDALPIAIKWRWTEGHQDDKVANLDDPDTMERRPLHLDWWALQNIRMDAAAKRHGNRTKHNTPPNIRFKHEKWAVWVGDRKLSSFRKNSVHDMINDEAVTAFWKNQRSNKMTDEQWNSFNKKALKAAAKERPTGKNRFMGKFATGHFGCGRQMLRRKEWSHDNCPVCGAPDEDNKHVPKCKDERSRETWKKTIKALEDWMKEADTHPDIRKHILRILETWVEDQPAPQAPSNVSREMKVALQQQSNLGGWNTILGRVSADLETRQDIFYKATKSWKTGRRWTVDLIKKLQDIAWDMWDHRNSVLHSDPDRHHRKTELEEVNADTEKEWKRGTAGLLQQDHHLFRSRETVDDRDLENKREWLGSVQGARDAAATATAARRRAFLQERRGIRHFVEGRNVRGRPLPTREQD